MDRWGEGRLEGVGVRVWVEELVEKLIGRKKSYLLPNATGR